MDERDDDDKTPPEGMVPRRPTAESRTIANLAGVVHSIAARLVELGRDLDRAKGSERDAILDRLERALSRGGDLFHESRSRVHEARRGLVRHEPAQLVVHHQKPRGKRMKFEWILRIAGYALTVAGPIVAAKVNTEAGTAMAAMGGMLLHKATPTIVPKRPIP